MYTALLLCGLLRFAIFANGLPVENLEQPEQTPSEAKATLSPIQKDAKPEDQEAPETATEMPTLDPNPGGTTTPEVEKEKQSINTGQEGVNDPPQDLDKTEAPEKKLAEVGQGSKDEKDGSDEMPGKKQDGVAAPKPGTPDRATVAPISVAMPTKGTEQHSSVKNENEPTQSQPEPDSKDQKKPPPEGENDDPEDSDETGQPEAKPDLPESKEQKKIEDKQEVPSKLGEDREPKTTGPPEEDQTQPPKADDKPVGSLLGAPKLGEDQEPKSTGPPEEDQKKPPTEGENDGPEDSDETEPEAKPDLPESKEQKQPPTADDKTVAPDKLGEEQEPKNTGPPEKSQVTTPAPNRFQATAHPQFFSEKILESGEVRRRTPTTLPPKPVPKDDSKDMLNALRCRGSFAPVTGGQCEKTEQVWYLRKGMDGGQVCAPVTACFNEKSHFKSEEECLGSCKVEQTDKNHKCLSGFTAPKNHNLQDCKKGQVWFVRKSMGDEFCTPLEDTCLDKDLHFATEAECQKSCGIKPNPACSDLENFADPDNGTLIFDCDTPGIVWYVGDGKCRPAEGCADPEINFETRHGCESQCRKPVAEDERCKPSEERVAGKGNGTETGEDTPCEIPGLVWTVAKQGGRKACTQVHGCIKPRSEFRVQSDCREVCRV